MASLTIISIAEVGNYSYGPGHPMKPHRIRMAHSLLVNYGVINQLQLYVSSPLNDYRSFWNFIHNHTLNSNDLIWIIEKFTNDTP